MAAWISAWSAESPKFYEVNSNPDVKLNPKSNGVEARDRSNVVFRDNFLAAIAAIDFLEPAEREGERAV